MCSSSFSCTSYLHFPHGLHMDAAALAALLESRVKGIHQDDSSQARSLLPLHVLQKHLSLLHFVADDRGDVSCKETKRVNTSSVREIKKDPDEGLIWYAVNASLRFSKFSPLLLTLIRSVQSIVPRISDSAALICTKSPQIIVVSVASGHFKYMSYLAGGVCEAEQSSLLSTRRGATTTLLLCELLFQNPDTYCICRETTSDDVMISSDFI